MEKQYKIEESATNKPRFIHRSSFTNNSTSIVSAMRNKTSRNSFTGRTDKGLSYIRGSPSSFGSNSSDVRTLDLHKKPTIDSFLPLPETNDTTDSVQKSYNVTQDVNKSRSTTDSELAITDKYLKEKLAASLSPSPFRNEDPNMTEARLDHLIASSLSTTKTILFYPFYENGIEQMAKANHRAWKIALKDHIVHTLESICLIKNLSTVPAHSIEKIMLPPGLWTGKIFI